MPTRKRVNSSRPCRPVGCDQPGFGSNSPPESKKQRRGQGGSKPKLQALRDQVAKLNQQLDAAKNATESAWGDVKASFQKGYGELKDGFNQARQWVSDKIAP